MAQLTIRQRGVLSMMRKGWTLFQVKSTGKGYLQLMRDDRPLSSRDPVGMLTIKALRRAHLIDELPSDPKVDLKSYKLKEVS